MSPGEDWAKIEIHATVAGPGMLDVMAGGTAGETSLTIPIDQTSPTAAGTPYTVTAGNISTTVRVVVASVQITSSGDLKIIQDSNTDNRTIELVGYVQPPDLDVSWVLSDLNPDIVSTQNTFNPTTGQTSTKISLDHNMAGWDKWNSAISWLGVTLKGNIPQGHPLILSLSDSRIVEAWKFSRNGQFSKGSQSVIITLPHQGTGIGHAFRTPDPNDPNDNGLSIEKDVFASLDQETSVSPADDLQQDWKLFYASTSDVGDGTFAINESITFDKTLEVSAQWNGTYYNIHDETIAAAVACSAGVNNNSVDNVLGKIGIGYDGHPITVTVSIGANGSKKEPAIGGGLSVTVALFGADFISDTDTSSGSYQVQITGNHVALTTISPLTVPALSQTVKIAAGVNLTQLVDNDWHLFGRSFIKATVPSTPKIVFTPGY